MKTRLRNFLIRLLTNAVALAVTATLLPGVSFAVHGIWALLLVALVIGIVNAIVKPIVIVLTLPVTILTVGLFIFVINGLMLLLTTRLTGGLIEVQGLGAAILGGIIMGFVEMILEALFESIGWSEEQEVEATP